MCLHFAKYIEKEQQRLRRDQGAATSQGDESEEVDPTRQF